MRKLRVEKDKYDLVILNGSLHCLSTIGEIKDVINVVKQSTKKGGYNIIQSFNSEKQDLSGHSPDFKPLLITNEEYINEYSDWKILDSIDDIIEDIHPNNNIKHFHSITRLLLQK